MNEWSVMESEGAPGSLLVVTITGDHPPPIACEAQCDSVGTVIAAHTGSPEWLVAAQSHRGLCLAHHEYFY